MENPQTFSFKTSSSSFSNSSSSTKRLVRGKAGAVKSSDTASAAASEITSNGSAPISTILSSAPSSTQSAFWGLSSSAAATFSFSFSAPTSMKQNTTSTTSLFSASTPPSTIFGIASSSHAMFSSVFQSPSSSPLLTVETSQIPIVAENPKPLLPEKLAEVHLEIVDQSEQQKTKEDYPVPNDVAKTEEKPEVNSNLAFNSALPLRLIHISRILKGIPQSPHFLHLRKYSELAQEKLVAVWDQIFEEVVEQVQTLKTKDFWVMAGKLWKTMEDLQGMGYNVVPIRRRLVEMTEVMIELKQSKLEIVELRNKAENHRMERSRLESVILNLQVRAEREGAYMLQVLNEVDKMEKQLPEYDALVANLAMKPFVVHI